MMIGIIVYIVFLLVVYGIIACTLRYCPTDVELWTEKID